MREKWKVRRGWIEDHALIDVETNQILSLKVTDETTQDGQVFEMFLDLVERNRGGTLVKSMLGDGTYTQNQCFNELEKRGICSGIKTGSIHHDDPGDLLVEQHAFVNGITWAGMGQGFFDIPFRTPAGRTPGIHLHRQRQDKR